MKNIISGTVFTAVLLAFLALLLTLLGRHARQTETEEALKLAAEQSLANAMDTRSYTIDTKEDLIADFQENLLYQMEGDGDIEIQIEGADPEKGLLSVTVTEEFRQFLGGTGKARYAATLVMEKAGASRYVTVTYLDEASRLLRRYRLPQGASLPVPEGNWEKVRTDENGNVIKDQDGFAVAEKTDGAAAETPKETAEENAAYRRLP